MTSSAIGSPEQRAGPVSAVQPASKAINVAVVIDTIATDTAGTQKQLLETIRRLSGDGVEIQLVCLWESPWMAGNVLPCKCTVLGYEGFLKRSFPKVVARLARLFEQEQIQIAHTYFEDSIFVTWAAAIVCRRRVALVSSRRDIGLGSGNQPWYHALFRLALPVVNLRFARIVANSENVRRHVARRERTPLDRIVVIYNGVDAPRASGAKPRVFEMHAGDLWIALVASLTPVKRHDLALDALAELRTTHPSLKVHFVLLGEGPTRAALEAQATALGIAGFVHFEGAVADVSAYLRHVDVGLLCSDREGLSNAILEYMAHGLPVIATDVGGNSELVDASNGWLVRAGDSSALRGAIAECSAAATRASRSQASRARAESDFGWTRSLHDLERLYRELTANQRTDHHRR